MNRYLSISSFLSALLAACAVSLSAQVNPPDRFVGTLTFEASDGKLTSPVRYYSDGERLRIEMGSPEMPSRIWLYGVTDVEGVLALSPFKKTYTIEQDELVLPHGLTRKERSKSKDKRKPVIIPEPEPAQLLGLDCQYFRLETEGGDTEVWVLPNAVTIPLTVFGVWRDFIEAAPDIAKAIHSQKGLPLKIERDNWRGKALFSLTLTAVDTSPPDPARFVLPEDYSRGGAAAQLRRNQRDGIGN
jgi:hypothetical protein